MGSGKYKVKPSYDGGAKSNRINTSKYSYINFLPKNLFEQLTRFANIYFIFIVFLNWVPAVNAFGKEIAMVPVLAVLAATAVKDLYEDIQRHKSDEKVNSKNCEVLR